jgi:riboflavin kinase/FMN adenylyltransferase
MDGRAPDVNKVSLAVVTSLPALPPALHGATVALGNFDGVHRGHAAVLAAAHAARPDAPRALLTFEPHPREVFRPDDPPFRLTLPAAKARALAALGVQAMVALPFDRAFSELPAETFFDQVLHRGLGAAHLACGPDFAFGHRRGGDVALLARLAEAAGIGLTVVPPLADAQGPLSSTRIRRLLQDGYPDRAAAELGRDWEIEGVVAHGEKRGRTIGFPTANLALGRHLEPARGVYAVRTTLADGTVVPGVANIGRRPTVASGLETRLEAHLFDFAGDLYGQTIRVALHAFLRPERRFAGLDELTAQIAEDARTARALDPGPGGHQD